MIAAMVMTIALAGMSIAQEGPPQGFKCNECHSKNPKLLKMHQALNYANCGLCHRSTDRSMSAMRMSEAEKLNRAFDPRCMRCHKK